MKIFPNLLMSKGFTLLEVMIAVALMAIALVTLIGSQSQSVAVMDDVRFEAIAGYLAREKITELRLTDFDLLNNDTGSFENEFENFVWQVEVSVITGNELGLDSIDGLLKSINVTISQANDPSQKFSVQTIFCRKPVNREES